MAAVDRGALWEGEGSLAGGIGAAADVSMARRSSMGDGAGLGVCRRRRM